MRLSGELICAQASLLPSTPTLSLPPSRPLSLTFVEDIISLLFDLAGFHPSLHDLFFFSGNVMGSKPTKSKVYFMLVMEHLS